MDKLKLLILALASILFSCSKSAGTGGRSTIKGIIMVKNINILGTIVDTYQAQDEDVFIVYGNQNNTYDDDISTSHDGSFEFNYLNPGDYEIFLYSECINCAQGQDSLILKPVTIENSNEIVEIDTIYIANFI